MQTPSTRNGRGTTAAMLLALVLLPAVAAADAQVHRHKARDRDVRVLVPGEEGAIFVSPGRRGFLGVHVLDLTPELRRHFRADEDSGVLVSRVEEGSPAAAAGVAVGDVLVAVDGEEIESSWDLRRAIGPKRGGDTAELDVVRSGRSVRLSARLEERQAQVIDLGDLLRRDPDGRPLLALPSEAEWEELGERLGHLGEEIGGAVEQLLENPSVRLEIGEEMRRRRGLERQIEVLERRLQELERRLEEQRR